MGIDIEANYRRYGPMVLRRCRALLRDEDAAVDAMHDVFVKLLRRQPELDERGVCSLLFHTATNTCLDVIRAAKRTPSNAGEHLIAEIASLDDQHGVSQMRRLADQIFAGESTSTRAMAVLHFVDGYTHEEVAAAVEMSVSGVRKRLRTLQSRLVPMREAV